MDPIQESLNLNFSYLFVSFFIILFAIKTIISLFEWVFNKFGIETKWMKHKREDHDLLIKTAQELSVLENKYEEYMKKSDERDNELCKDVQKFTKMFIDEKIEDLRWKILDFSSAVSNGRKYNRESFDHIINIYDKYEEILKENGMKNGLAEESIRYIREKYVECLRNGSVEFSEEFTTDIE